MATKVTITAIAGDYGSKELINANFVALADEIDNCISRDGTAPNTMLADLDLNSNKIINLLDPTNAQDGATKAYVDSVIATGAANAAAAAASAAAALVSENNAATSETNAQAAETAAQAAQAAAEAALDAFDDIYLGAKAADPTLDNDGDPLSVGDLYFNTVLNQIKVYDGATWSVAPQIPGIVSNADATAITIDSNERVGIGTSSPDTPLHIGGASAGMRIQPSDATNATIYLRHGSVGNNSGFIASNASDLQILTNGAEAMRIDSSGQIGIGTTTINNTFVVGGAGSQRIQLSNDTVGYTAGDGFQVNIDTSGNVDVINREAGFMAFRTSDTERMRITSAGDIGMGYTPPANAAGYTQAFVGKGLTLMGNQAASDGYILGNSYYDGTNFRYTHTATASRIRPNFGGAFTFDRAVSGTAGNIITYSESMRIDSSGNVGIGRTPTYFLDVLYNGTNYVSQLENSHATTPNGLFVHFSGASPDDNTQQAIRFSDSTTHRFSVYSDGDVLNHDGTYGTISDRRLKQDIVNANSQWDDIKAIGSMGRNYRHKKDVEAKGEQAKTMLGWEAQDIDAVSPGLVMHTFDEDGNETLGIRSSILFTKGIMALSENMTRTEILEKMVQMQETKHADLAARVAVLEAAAA